MRSAPSAHATRSGSRSRSLLIAVVSTLALIHPGAAAAKATNGSKQVNRRHKAKHHAEAAKTASKNPTTKVAKHSKQAGKSKHGTPVRSAKQPAANKVAARHQRSKSSASAKARGHGHAHVVARYHDPSKLVIPEGDGSPVLTVAANYLGRPYRFGSEGQAFDCSGFVRTVFADMGVALPHSARELSALGDRIDREELEPGDLVFFRNPRRQYATHVGIYVGDDKFVHAATRGGQVQVDSLSDTYYTQHYFCARRIEI